MAAGAGGGGWCAFPVVVQGGPWGSRPDHGLPKTQQRNKLLRYFQSRKRSGGGECEIQSLEDGRLLICFAEEGVRQRVLSKKTHKLDLGGNEVLEMVVSLPDETTTKDKMSKEEKVYEGEEQAKEMAEKSPPKTDGVERDLQKEDSNKSQVSPLVALGNIDDSISSEVITLLTENISGLSVEKDLHIELIRERNAAVITFARSRDAVKFVDLCTKNPRIKEYRITATSLEFTQMIKVENIPPKVEKGFVTLYFESPKHGGGTVTDVQMLPDEDSAVVTFCDYQAVQRVLEQQHSFDHQSVSVYPFYSSLGTVLYGKERLTIQMPEPITVPLDPYVWKFLQGKHKIIQEIDKEMENCFCDLIWPLGTCEHPEVLIRPSTALQKQGRSLVKTWKENISKEFACIMSKFKSSKCKIIPATWEAIESILINDVLAIPDVSKEMAILAGFVSNVDNMENKVEEYIELLTRETEKAKQKIQETLSVTRGKYDVLYHVLKEDNAYKENSGIVFSYDPSAQIMQLTGMPVEVYKMKSDILENLQKMQEKKVLLPPVVLQFLLHADSRNVSAILFHARNVKASFDLAADSVALVGYFHEDLLKAKKLMKKDLDYKSITLENQQLTNRREWKDLCKRLLEKHNSLDKAVVINDSVLLGEGAQVTIAGYTKVVADVCQELYGFVEKNTQVLKVIPVKSVVVVQFLKKEKGNVLCDLKRKGVKFELQVEEKNVVLSGPKTEVMKAAAVIEDILSLVHSATVRFDKPGVKDSFKQRERFYIDEAKLLFSCLIQLQTSQKSERKAASPRAKITFKGVEVEAHKGDLTHFLADVVVNASNEMLQHIGGLAEALSKAAGPQLQAECNDLLKKHGNLRPGQAIITAAGNLPCKQIIHAVGPRWNTSEKEKCTWLLKKAVWESLKLAETYNHCSVAIPAVSSGIFGFPVKESVRCIVTAVKESLEDSSETKCLKQIYLVDVSDDTVQAFADALHEVFGEKMPLPKLSTGPSLDTPQAKETGEDVSVSTTSEGLKLILEKKGIEDATTDVVISSIGKDLKLGVGPLSKALLQRAGPALQAEFDQEVRGNQAQTGCVIQTRGHNLTSRFVFHAVVPSWDGGKGKALKELKSIVKECLEKTEKASLSSVSFTAIGTGGFSFPKSEVAKVMFEEVLQFSSRKNFKFLQEIHFILHPNDKDNIQAFSQEFESRMAGGAVPGFFGPISTPVSGIDEMLIGSIKFQLLTGDITKENTDVIVNVTNSTFNAKSGVSQAILEAGGPQVEKECADLASGPHKGFITTDGGNLPCKKIIHLAPGSGVKAQVSMVLQECEAKKYTSVALPAIGTGQAQQSPEDAADAMMKAIADFAGKESPQHLQIVKVIVFQPHMKHAFYTSMQKREGFALPREESLLSKLISTVTGKKKRLFLKKKVEVAVFEICGENKWQVEEAESWLKKTILQEQSENLITDEIIGMFDDAEVEKLNELQKALHVTIQLDREDSPFIFISGISRDVLEAFTKIQKLIKKIKDDQEEKSKAEFLKNLVEWQYSTLGNDYKPVDMLTSLHLEDARKSKKRHINIQIHGRSCMVDLQEMCADDQGRKVHIKRVVKEEDRGELPTQWEDMNGDNVKVVSLHPTTQEYKHVEAKFKMSCSFTIEKIERVQNPYLWQQYQVKKQDLEKKNGHTKNENILFHGTTDSSLVEINHNGFNRIYAGKNAAMYGRGTYFAVNASYSANDTYSRPDSSGRKYMYLARVLTGDYCNGSAGLLIPPAKNPGSFDLYDSVTDNKNNPQIFVIFSDAQAYPEYLITF